MTTSRPWNPEDYRGLLYMLARCELGRRLQSKVGASDVVQESLVTAHRELPKFRGTSEIEFRTWLQTILRSKLATVLRFYHRGKRDARLEHSLDAGLSQSSLRLASMLAGPDSTPSREAAQRERLLSLANALGALPEDQREAVELKHLEQLPVKEICARLDKSEAAVAGLLRRGLAQLRKLLHEDAP